MGNYSNCVAVCEVLVNIIECFLISANGLQMILSRLQDRIMRKKNLTKGIEVS
ncbi:hypothetical protein J1N35_036502 [Gossypium stocksii]|uniref:Uncharacterized protein n=1 Tax=Gossypium stocksii TaxID=47602 RepID=A0A9D3UI80_9ROSI|nr:hypothetical protein J1N35_036502 [Gossypium stocksii]